MNNSGSVWHVWQRRLTATGANGPENNDRAVEIESVCGIMLLFVFLIGSIVEGSAFTPAPSTRNFAVDYNIVASIGVTDVRVQ